MIQTPSNLELLLHCYYSSEPHPRLGAPAIKEGIKYLVAHKMITADPSSSIYNVTDKGRAYIEHLMQIPFPVCKWEIPS